MTSDDYESDEYPKFEFRGRTYFDMSLIIEDAVDDMVFDGTWGRKTLYMVTEKNKFLCPVGYHFTLYRLSDNSKVEEYYTIVGRGNLCTLRISFTTFSTKLKGWLNKKFQNLFSRVRELF